MRTARGVERSAITQPTNGLHTTYAHHTHTSITHPPPHHAPSQVSAPSSTSCRRHRRSRHHHHDGIKPEEKGTSMESSGEWWVCEAVPKNKSHVNLGTCVADCTQQPPWVSTRR